MRRICLFFCKIEQPICFYQILYKHQMSDNKNKNNSKSDYNALLSRLKKREEDRVKIEKELKALFPIKVKKI